MTPGRITAQFNYFLNASIHSGFLEKMQIDIKIINSYLQSQS